jgi:hypothetical protein
VHHVMQKGGSFVKGVSGRRVEKKRQRPVHVLIKAKQGEFIIANKVPLDRKPIPGCMCLYLYARSLQSTDPKNGLPSIKQNKHTYLLITCHDRVDLFLTPR